MSARTRGEVGGGLGEKESGRLAAVERDAREHDVEMVGEETADEVVLVADAGLARGAGGEKKAGVFESAGGENEILRGDRKAIAGKGCDLHRERRFVVAVHFDFDGVGVEHEAEVGSLFHLVEKGLAESGGIDLEEDVGKIILGRVEEVGRSFRASF